VEPAYLKTKAQGLLTEKIAALGERMESCDLCPRECRVDRFQGSDGFCRTGSKARVASFNPHFGEESPLVGKNGSGTIFFSGCNLGCLFCQNEDISLGGQGTEIGADRLAGIMLRLQEMGCHNINLVTPTHQVLPIMEALEIAIGEGLRLPLVYNCGGYESVATLKLLDGIVDIYMPDFKFGEPGPAEKYTDAGDYPDRAGEALTEMHAQVGDLTLDDRGVARQGLLVRHLVLPRGLAGTKKVTEFVAGLSKATYTNIMAQYRPCGRTGEFPEMARAITGEEHRGAVKDAFKAGLTRLDKPGGFSLARFF
jgi:putative pyruvate formate lyase activating enzyme